MKHYPALQHSPIEAHFDGVWTVRGSIKMPMLMPMRFGRTMTIFSEPGSTSLTVVNSMRLSEAGFAALDELGSVDRVIRVGGFHGRDDGYYRERYGAKIYAIAGQHYSRKMDAKAPAKNYLEPDGWLDESSELPVANASLKVIASSTPTEGLLLLKREGGILITGDSLQHTPAPDEFTNFPAKLMMKKMGFFKAHNVGPGWLQFASPDADDVRSILALDFEHVMPGHGHAVIGNAKRKFRPNVQGPLAGCHEDSRRGAA